MFSWRAAWNAVVHLPEAAGRPSNRSSLPELDGLRCLSILVVLVWHASLRAARFYGGTQGPQDDSLYAVFPHGEIGVLMFFVISGFIVSRSFLRGPWTASDVILFYKRRVVRLVPPYAAVLVVAAVTLGLVGHVPVGAYSYQQSDIPLGRSLVASLFYLHGFIYNAPSRLNPPMWSLELEVVFYALLPFVILLYVQLRRRVHRLMVAACVVAAAILLANSLSALQGVDGRFRLGLLYYGYYFLIGIALADAVGSSLKERPKHWAADLAFAASAGLLFYAGLLLTASDARPPHGIGTVLLQAAIAVALVVMFVTAFSGRLASRLLRTPWIAFIGAMCYSIYLTHIVVMQALSEILAKIVHSDHAAVVWAVWLFVLVPCSVAGGTVFYLLVERPFALAASSLRSPLSRSAAILRAPTAPSRSDASADKPYLT